MANTREIKQRISTAGNISKITKAMEMVSASKMRRAQQQALQARHYAQALTNSLKILTPQIDETLHPLLKNNNSERCLAVIIATDKGLCGSLNQTLLKELVSWIKSHPNSELITVGKKAMLFCQFYGLPIFAQFTNLPDTISVADIQPIITLISNEYTQGKAKLVELFFMDFVNTLIQHPAHSQLLPIEQTVGGENEIETKTSKKSEYIFEPSAQEIFNHLLPYYVENSLFQAFLESRASEHSARMVTMKNASENAGELISELKLIFNKQRQSSITNELLDITTATLSLQNQREESYV